MNTKGFIKLKRILACYLAICMIVMAFFPYVNISYASTLVPSNISRESGNSGSEPQISSVEVTINESSSRNLENGDSTTSNNETSESNEEENQCQLAKHN